MHQDPQAGGGEEDGQGRHGQVHRWRIQCRVNAVARCEEFVGRLRAVEFRIRCTERTANFNSRGQRLSMKRNNRVPPLAYALAIAVSVVLLPTPGALWLAATTAATDGIGASTGSFLLGNGMQWFRTRRPWRLRHLRRRNRKSPFAGAGVGSGQFSLYIYIQ